jgi:hypothetical protein
MLQAQQADTTSASRSGDNIDTSHIRQPGLNDNQMNFETSAYVNQYDSLPMSEKLWDPFVYGQKSAPSETPYPSGDQSVPVFEGNCFDLVWPECVILKLVRMEY